MLNRNHPMLKKLLVSDLSEDISQNKLAEYFSQYPGFYDIKIKTFSQSYKYGELTVLDDYTTKTLIKHSPHLIEGMEIRVIPFTEEYFSELIEDWGITKKRICVFGIPKTYKNKKFKDIFYQEFGPIESAYVRQNKSKNFNFGFVAFRDEETVERALKQRFLNYFDQEERVNVSMEMKEFTPKGVDKRKKKKMKNNQKIYLLNNKLQYNKCEFFDLIFQEEARMSQKSQFQNKKIKEFPFTIPLEFFKIYITNILINNLKIKGLTQDDVRSLELFYFNQKGAVKNESPFNSQSVALRFAKKVSINHKSKNIRFNRY